MGEQNSGVGGREAGVAAGAGAAPAARLPPSALLDVDGIETAYGRSKVLFGVSLKIAPGEMVTLMGRNGMGKTTTVRSIMGLTPASTGSIRLAGSEIRTLPSYRVAKLGVGLVPEGRQVFPNLNVAEHLGAFQRAGSHGDATWNAARVYELFPALAERRRHLGNQLSGGEQQMLAIGRALVTNPRLLILDEATEGLAPLVREQIWRALERLRASGIAMIVIDKYVQRLIAIGDRHCILEKGRGVWQGSSDALDADRSLWHRYLGV